MKAILLTVAVALTLTACSNGNNASTSKVDSTANAAKMDTTHHATSDTTTTKVADTTKKH